MITLGSARYVSRGFKALKVCTRPLFVQARTGSALQRKLIAAPVVHLLVYVDMQMFALLVARPSSCLTA